MAARTIEGCTEGAVLRAVLPDVLLPHVRPGQIVMLDTLKAHTGTGGAEVMAAAGARLLSRPPYAPDFSPLAECGSTIKARLRAKAARTREALELAITAAFAAVTASDAYGWFTHAGYCRVSN